MRIGFLAIAAIWTTLWLSPARSKDSDIVDIPPGATVDVYFQINLKGQVYLNIRRREGPGCVGLWWIVWPLGTIKDLGEQCGVVKLDIPEVWQFSVASKLRARGGDMPIKIGVAADERVANSISFSFP